MRENAEKALSEYAEKLINDMKLSLGANRSRKNYRASWSNGKLKSYKVTRSNRRIDPKGPLGESLDYNIQVKNGNLFLDIQGLDYALYVNEGRKPGKGIPIKAMNDWLGSPKIKLQGIKKDKNGKLISTGFVSKTPKLIKSVGFLMNRKIKTFGIEPVPFIDEAIKKNEGGISLLEEAYAKDIAEEIAKETGGKLQ